ncbi:MAG: metal-dependent hydrolase [Polycyclovorans sp.]|nr:metal-dependent hydrolase [Polycyclovorans sp.]MDP1542680.1 metal-dependent hydrolase [Polycyclovorans sp.]MEC8849809.1 metal-dependent hydrolase [Pseudomonadota bacterium]|tara:strand:+ start:34855 stop:35748 length:894 start_codon:yes stop_codon:yes gene_type:complete
MALANRKIGYDEVKPRDLHFDMTDVPKYWMNNDPWTTHWWNALLAAVPDGERWVMQCVRKNLVKVSDEKVRKAGIDFIKQEHFHAREHDIMNKAVMAHGVPVDKVEDAFKRTRTFLQRFLSEDMQLSTMAAGEHFTGTISAVFVDHPEIFKDFDPSLGAMIAWHMIEETEHKSVSFDVYQDAVGSYPKRIAGMVLMTGIFFAISEYQRLILVAKDGHLFNWRSALKGLKFQFTQPGFMRLLVKHYLPYYSPNFHPWDHDNRAQLRAWKDTFDATGDTMKAYKAFIGEGPVSKLKSVA